VASLADAHRDVRGFPWLDAIRHDVRHAARMFRRAPWFFAGTVLTLALGIGANGAVFGIVQAVLFQPLPYRAPDRLVMVWGGVKQPGRHEHFGDLPLRAHADANDAIESASYQDWQERPATRFDLTLGNRAERVNGAAATANFFDVLGVSAAHGRVFTAAEEAAGAQVIVLSHALWRQVFNGDASVIGRSITMMTGSPKRPQSFTIIGVLPAGVHVTYPEETQAWIILPWRDISKAQGYWTIGRLRDGQSLESAQARLRTVPAADRDPSDPPGRQETFKLEPMKDWIVGDSRPALVLLAAVAGVLLLVACATVASAFFVRLAERQRELAMRAAIGADRRRLGQQLLTEGLLLSLLGSGLGALAAAAAGPVLRALIPASVPRADEIGPNWWTVVFFAAAAATVTILAALGPAWSSARVDVVSTLKRGSAGASADRSTARWRRSLVGIQSAMSTALLLTAALLLVSFWKLTHVPTGFDGQQVLAAEMELNAPKYRQLVEPPQPGAPAGAGRTTVSPAVAAFQQNLLTRVRTIPGVIDAGTTSALPFRNPTFSNEVMRAGAAPRSGFGYVFYIDPGYLTALKARIVRGRNFTSADTIGAPRVVLLSESVAHRLFGDENPIGQIVDNSGPVEVVGVVNDIRYVSFERAPQPALYFPNAQAPNSRISLIARLDARAERVDEAIRAAVAALDPDTPVITMTRVDQILSASVADRRFYSIATATLAALALILTIVGLAVVVSRTVVERRREMAIRSALGASGADLIRSVMVPGLAPVGLGIVAGLGSVLAGATLLQQFLFETAPRLPLLYGGVAALVAVVAVIAAVIPARQARSSSPAAVMRAE
jgi:predicted permease